MSLISEIEKVVSSVVKFFGKFFTSQTWRTVFLAGVQALAGIVEGILEAAKDDPAAKEIAAIVNTIHTDLGTVAGLASGYTSGAHNTFVALVTNIVNTVQSDLGSILSMLDVKNTALVASVTEIVNMAAAGIEALLKLIPTTPTTPTQTT